MLQSPSYHWVGDERRRQCLRIVTPAVRLLVEKGHHGGWNRDEILIAIADAADEQLCALTDGPAETPGETGDQPVDCRDEAAQKKRHAPNPRVTGIVR